MFPDGASTEDDAEREKALEGDFVAKFVSFVWAGFEAVCKAFFIALFVVPSVSTCVDLGVPFFKAYDGVEWIVAMLELVVRFRWDNFSSYLEARGQVTVSDS